MKITCTASDFINIIEPACYVASKAMLKTNPFNDLITIKTEDNKINLLSFNGMMSLNTNIENVKLENDNMKVEGVGKITISSTNLLKNIKSFRDEEELIIELYSENDQKDLRISKKEDLEEFQSLPCYSTDISTPDYARVDIAKEIEVHRETFVAGANRVNFAQGDEKSGELAKFSYWLLRFAGSKMRFAAGDNRRFPILDVNGDGIFKTKAKTANIMFPKEQSAVLLKLLSSSKCNTFKIKESKKTSLYYQLFEFDNHSLIISHVDPNIQWPDESKILNKDIKTKFVVSAEDWAVVAKAVDAAFDGEEIDNNKSEVVTLKTEFKENLLHIEVNETHRISRKVSFLDYWSETGEDLEFKVFALYLKEIFNKGEKQGKYQFDFGEVVENANGDKTVGPFFVRYYADEKVQDKKEIKLLDNGTGWQYQFLFIILPTMK